MKNFFKLVFASMLGTFLAVSAGFFFLMMIVAALSTFGEKQNGWSEALGSIKDNSVMAITFEGPIVDHLERSDFFESLFRQDAPPAIGLFEITETLRTAAGDDRIKGLFLNLKHVRGGVANVEALRREIVHFRDSGKFVLAYSETYDEISYVLATAADEIILYPRGFFEWDGLFAKLSFFKNTLKKIDVTPQVFRVGKYKSAIEPFINDKMSPESREQLQAIIETLWDQIVSYAADRTKKTGNELDVLANDLSVLYGKQAFESGFVNFLSSFEDVERKLVELTNAKDKPEYVGWRSYYKQHVENKYAHNSDHIALVFAEGEIISGRGDRDQISSESLAPLLRKLAQDEKVKAVVLRVNSPGGSALASDVIWTSTQHLKDKKPLVTSFGNVAASGGYYMSAGSQYIFSESTTITGSIGVFGLSFATQKLWNDTFGVTFDTEKSHRFADMESLVRPLDPAESQKMQEMVERVYEDFLNVVTLGRKSIGGRDQVHELAQGRVWIGKQAKEIGLVDELGGMHQALDKASELANFADYEVAVYPKPKNPFEDFIMQFTDVSLKFVKAWVPQSLIPLFDKDLKETPEKLIKARMPLDIVIH
ncbi:MAG: signal peptide peptidase SppA [Bdellovibrionales bacterium]|nr:signal peptide peptidase SppA [Bdellovibrionales bacterium]